MAYTTPDCKYCISKCKEGIEYLKNLKKDVNKNDENVYNIIKGEDVNDTRKN